MLDLILDFRSLAALALTAAALLGAGGHVVMYKRDSRAAMGWLALIVSLPIIGALLYWAFGINRIFRKAEAAFRGYQPLEAADPIGLVEPAGVATEAAPHLSELAAFGQRVHGKQLIGGNRVEPLYEAEDGLEAMLAAVEKAERSITLQTYIFDHDPSGLRFLEALRRAVKRDVEVRVLIDAVGDRYTRPPMRGMLLSAGVPADVFMPTRLPRHISYANLRNHRKLMIVDGRLGFTGGLNIRQPHGEKLALQDMHFRVEGPALHGLQRVFADDWAFSTGERLAGEQWFPSLEEAGSVVVRVVNDGPAENFGHLRWTLLGALACARRRVSIVTPYFLPDEGLVTALNMAARRGVEVNIVMPSENNLKVVQWATSAMLWQVLQCGCRVFASPPPFDHSKLMLVDDAWSFIGSANWDPRSLRLNFELNLEAYCPHLTGDLETFFESKRQKSWEITLDAVDGRSVPVRLRDGVARLLTPYL